MFVSPKKSRIIAHNLKHKQKIEKPMKHVIFILFSLSLLAVSCKEEEPAPIFTQSKVYENRIAEYDYLVSFDFSGLKSNECVYVNTEFIGYSNWLKHDKYINYKASTFIEDYFPEWYKYDNAFNGGEFYLRVYEVDNNNNLSLKKEQLIYNGSTKFFY